MQYLSIDFLILYAFLAITLFIGLRTGRGIKDIREYATGNKMFTTGALVLTWLATDICGGDVVFDMPKAFKINGIIEIFPIMGWILAYLAQGLIFAPKFLNFPNCMTIGDVMKTLYKGPSQIMTGVLATLTATCIAGMEVTVLGLLAETLLGMNFSWGVVLGGGLLVLYTVHGGIKSVTYTDMFQFIILIAILPIITMIALHHAGGMETVIASLSDAQCSVLHHPKLSKYGIILLTLGIFQFGIIDPALVQRILLAKNKRQLRNQFLAMSILLFGILLSFMMLGFISNVLFPGDTISHVVPQIIQHILPVGLKGFAYAGLFAITMATFDSFLHAAGLTLAHDVIAPIYNRQGKSINELRLTRYITLSIGFIVILLGLLRLEDPYDFLIISYTLTGPLLAFPLFAGVLGLKPDKYAFYIASIITVATLLLAKWLVPEEQQRLVNLISVCVNGIFFLGIHAIRNKGFAIINYAKNQTYTWRPEPATWEERLEPYLPTPKNIFRFSTREVERCGAPYLLIGIFGVLNYIIPYYMWEHDTVEGFNLMIYIRVIAAVGCGLLIVKDQWASKLLPCFPLFWHAVLCYCLPFVNTVLLLLTNFSVPWLVNIALSVMLLIVLVDWTMFFILSGLGISLGFLFYNQVVGPIQVNMDFSSGYFVVYQVIVSLLICVLFVGRKHLRYTKLALYTQHLAASREENKQAYFATFKEKLRLIRTLKNANIKYLPDVVKGIKALKDQIQTDDALDRSSLVSHIKEIESKITPIALNLTGIDHRALDYLRLSVSPTSINQLLDELRKEFRQYGLVYIGKQGNETIICDPARILALLKNIVQVLPPLPPEAMNYVIMVEDTKLAYPLPGVKPTKDYVKYIPALRFAFTHNERLVPAVASQYTVDMSGSVIPATDCERAILLASNHRILRAHYGYTNVDISQSTNYDYFMYVIPVDLDTIRPKDMDLPEMELGGYSIRANDKYPGAAEQEEAFLDAVVERTSANIENVKSALELIKWYHGPVMRRSGEPFYLHPLSVAKIVLDWNQDEATIIGALLHDTVEDTFMLLDHVEMLFGTEVRNMVDYVTHFESFKDSFYKAKLNETENLDMLLQATERRSLFVKVADRMHNMRTIEGHKSKEKQCIIAKETLGFFVPLALALGIPQAAEELRERSTCVLEDEDS